MLMLEIAFTFARERYFVRPFS